MTVNEIPSDEDWRSLPDLGAEERQGRMQARYEKLAALPEEERRSQLKALASAEFSSSYDEFRLFTEGRLRAMLAMEFSAARTLALSYDAVIDQLPGDTKIQLVSAGQAVSRTFSTAELGRLLKLVPRPYGLVTEAPETQDRRLSPVRTDAEYAGLGVRSVAFIVDVVTVIVMGFILGIILGVMGLFPSETAAAVLQLIIAASYFTLFTGLSGQTLGKKMLGIKVIDAQNQKPGPSRAALREIIGKPVCAIVFLLGFIWIAIDPKNQGWHDKFAQTSVTRVDNPTLSMSG